jgi:hypothetical protein
MMIGFVTMGGGRRGIETDFLLKNDEKRRVAVGVSKRHYDWRGEKEHERERVFTRAAIIACA